MKKKYLILSTFLFSIFITSLFTSTIHHCCCHDQDCEICLILSTQHFIISAVVGLSTIIGFVLSKKISFISLNVVSINTLIKLKTKQLK